MWVHYKKLIIAWPGSNMTKIRLLLLINLQSVFIIIQVEIEVEGFCFNLHLLSPFLTSASTKGVSSFLLYDGFGSGAVERGCKYLL